MRIGFVGAGKVATAFGRYLHNQGIVISGYFDRHKEKTIHAAQATHSHACRNDIEVAACSDIILITTRDDQIQAAAEALCSRSAVDSHHLVGHMSGAHPSRILSKTEEAGAAVFSLHPLQAFAQEEKAVADLKHTWFSLDGTDPRIDRVAGLMDRTGNPYFRIQPEYKSLYHLAACIFSNYLVTLLQHGMTALEESGIEPQTGLTAMLPLIQGTLANVARLGPAKALTGPIARGDETTIRDHLAALEAGQLSELKAFYTYLGLKTLALAEQDVLRDNARVEALKQLLS